MNRFSFDFDILPFITAFSTKTEIYFPPYSTDCALRSVACSGSSQYNPAGRTETPRFHQLIKIIGKEAADWAGPGGPQLVLSVYASPGLSICLQSELRSCKFSAANGKSIHEIHQPSIISLVSNNPSLDAQLKAGEPLQWQRQPSRQSAGLVVL